MSPDSRVSTFVPATIAPQRADAAGESHASGFAAGWAAGARAAAEAAQRERDAERADHERREAARDAALCDALLALGAASRAWHERALPVLADAEESLNGAAMELAEAILGHELADGPVAARSVLARAASLPTGIDATVMRLHPETLAEVRRLADAGEATLADGIALAGDPRLAPGDVIVEHADGALDARIGAGLARARAALEAGL
ncbi:FliH/SctL family protein [Demequina subtropica]|uniref:FliH/SctL family protein n=1 Tax=Demequina subtropica TaxID=1638989 RepID=UPI0007821990|nr:FliH/SctL family protein [Demequina subtropica]